MSSSELSELTSNVSSDSEEEVQPKKKGTLDYHFNKNAKTPKLPTVKKKRPPSPPHEYVLADREEIAFLVMFRSRFSDLFPRNLSHLGPQDIENGVVGPEPSDQVERLLCALLGLVLNRKKEVEKGHYNRALEDAISSHSAQWPLTWQGKNPLSGTRTFNGMSPEEKLVLMKAIVLWSLDSSEAVKATIKESYKQTRQNDDRNQRLSVQPWGRDGDKRRFWLIEGQDDTHFRLYRESKPNLKNVTWRSLAGSIEELREMADKLSTEDTQNARQLRDRILAAIPRFEAGEDKRKRREYRQVRKMQFRRAEPGMSLYEGRTRGKRIRYTFSDEEGVQSDEQSTRRSNRQSGISTPAEPAAPRFTASGRQVRSRYGGEYGESSIEPRATPNPDGTSAMELDDEDGEPIVRGRRGRPSSAQQSGAGRPRKTVHEYDSLDESEGGSDASISSNEWKGGDDEADADVEEDEDDDEDLEMSEEDFEGVEEENRTLVVRLHYGKGQSISPQPGIKHQDHIAVNGVNGSLKGQEGLNQETKDHNMVDVPVAPAVVAGKTEISSNAGVNGAVPMNGVVAAEPTPPASQPAQTVPLDTQALSANPPSPPPTVFNPHAYKYADEKPAQTTQAVNTDALQSQKKPDGPPIITPNPT